VRIPLAVWRYEWERMVQMSENKKGYPRAAPEMKLPGFLLVADFFLKGRKYDNQDKDSQ
jgi:hypothetical protein